MIDIVLGFAVWRLTSLLQSEDGPWHIFLKLRRSIESHENPFECFWCLSLYVSIPFVAFISNSWGDLFVNWLAYSALAILIETIINKLEV